MTEGPDVALRRMERTAVLSCVAMAAIAFAALTAVYCNLADAAQAEPMISKKAA